MRRRRPARNGGSYQVPRWRSGGARGRHLAWSLSRREPPTLQTGPLERSAPMAIPPADPPPTLTPQDIDAWVLAAAERRAALHRKAASPWPSHYLQDVVTEMSDLL